MTTLSLSKATPKSIGFYLVESEDFLASFAPIAVNAVENQQHAQLRDWLLPRLMTGQVTLA